MSSVQITKSAAPRCTHLVLGRRIHSLASACRSRAVKPSSFSSSTTFIRRRLPLARRSRLGGARALHDCRDLGGLQLNVAIRRRR
jgi:hypothetical protein